MSLQESTLVAEFDKTKKTTPIISLTPTPTSSIPQLAAQPSSFLEMSHDVTTHMECIAAIVGHFSWRKVTPNYENHSTVNSSTSPLMSLSDALQLRMKKNRVFILLASSLRSCVLLFEKANQLGMMEERYIWIVSDNIASLLDSVDQSVISRMQDVVGFKSTNFAVNCDTFSEFKHQFREYSNHSIYELHTYDATGAAVKATQSSSETNFLEIISLSEINVISRSYREIGFWSPESGFSSDTLGSRQANANLGLIYRPAGGNHRIPSGYAFRDNVTTWFSNF